LSLHIMTLQFRSETFFCLPIMFFSLFVSSLGVLSFSKVVLLVNRFLIWTRHSKNTGPMNTVVTEFTQKQRIRHIFYRSFLYHSLNVKISWNFSGLFDMMQMKAKIEIEPIKAKPRTKRQTKMMNLPKLFFPTQLLIHVQ